MTTGTENKSDTDTLLREAQTSLTLNSLPYDIRCRLREFTGAEWKVFTAHLSHANKDHKRSYPSIKKLIQETGLCQNSIFAARRGLIKKGWLVKYLVYDQETGKRKSSTVFCKWPPPIPGSYYEKIAARRIKRTQK